MCLIVSKTLCVWVPFATPLSNARPHGGAVAKGGRQQTLTIFAPQDGDAGGNRAGKRRAPHSLPGDPMFAPLVRAHVSVVPRFDAPKRRSFMLYQFQTL